MTNILLPVLIVSGLGLAAGLLLSVVSLIMHVPKDERQEALRDVLPGANCGACGYAGCDAYAEAIAKGKADVTSCVPGGNVIKEQLEEIMGIATGGDVQKKAAFVQCFGSCENTNVKMQYAGEMTCSSASQVFGGPGECIYGCIGFGDCQAECEYGAIKICNGVAVIDMDLCKGCTKCVRACPKSIISMVPTEQTAVVSCSSRHKGGDVRKICKVGCTGCTLCQRACPNDAIRIKDFLSRVNPNKCTACGACVEKCPQNCIQIL